METKSLIWKLIAAGVAFIFPPLAMVMVRASLGALILNLLLTFIFLWVPGVIHALYTIFDDKK